MKNKIEKLLKHYFDIGKSREDCLEELRSDLVLHWAALKSGFSHTVNSWGKNEMGLDETEDMLNFIRDVGENL